MPTVKLISEAEASGKVKEVFEDIKRTRNIERIPNIWRALAANPAHLEIQWNKVKSVMADGLLDHRTKEIIAVAVSITNGCDYCINSHTAALKRLGLSDTAVGELVAVVDLFCGMNRVADAYQIEPDIRPPVEDSPAPAPQPVSERSDNAAYCSFCGKPESAVRKTIKAYAKPNIYICDRCIGVCNEILTEEGITNESH